MGSSENNNQNMNMIIPGRSIQTRTLSKNAIKTSLQTFTGVVFGIGALNNTPPPSNQTLTFHSILCSALGNSDHEKHKGRENIEMFYVDIFFNYKTKSSQMKKFYILIFSTYSFRFPPWKTSIQNLTR